MDQHQPIEAVAETSAGRLSKLAIGVMLGFMAAVTIFGGILLFYDGRQNDHGDNLTVKGDIWDVDPRTGSQTKVGATSATTATGSLATGPSLPQPTAPGTSPSAPKLATPPSSSAKDQPKKGDPKAEMLAPPKEDRDPEKPKK